MVPLAGPVEGQELRDPVRESGFDRVHELRQHDDVPPGGAGVEHRNAPRDLRGDARGAGAALRHLLPARGDAAVGSVGPRQADPGARRGRARSGAHAPGVGPDHDPRLRDAGHGDEPDAGRPDDRGRSADQSRRVLEAGWSPARQPLGTGPEPRLHEAGAARDPGVRAEHPPRVGAASLHRRPQRRRASLQHRLPVPESRRAGPEDHRAVRRPDLPGHRCRKLEAEGYSSFYYDVGGTETRWNTGGPTRGSGGTTAASPTRWASSSSRPRGCSRWPTACGVASWPTRRSWSGRSRTPNSSWRRCGPPGSRPMELGASPEGEVADRGRVRAGRPDRDLPVSAPGSGGGGSGDHHGDRATP
jgi:hypothetical protein